MASSNRSSNTQQTKSRTSGSQKQVQSKAKPVASAAKATAQARGGGSRAVTADPSPVYQQYQEEPDRGVLDESARHDIAGVIIAVIGVALLIAVIVPTTGVVTEAISDGLHTVFGLGAFLIPVALLLWALSFFVHVPRLVPMRVALGLLLIALAVMGLIGITTAGCVEDPSRLFNSYVLADRGGYIGNGFAWLLLTLTGQIVGIVILVGIIIAGLIVIGFNISQAARSGLERYRERQARRRAHMEEAEAARAQNGIRPGFEGMPQDIIGNYAPTALFDPSRPLTQQQGIPPTTPLADESNIATTYMPDGRSPYEAVTIRNTSAEAEPDYPDATTFLQPVPEPGEDIIQYDQIPEGPGYANQSAPSIPGMQSVVSSVEGDTFGTQPSRPRTTAQWWDPVDEWIRDEFNPADMQQSSSHAPIPGVLPGAPVFVEETDASSSPITDVNYSYEEEQIPDIATIYQEEAEAYKAQQHETHESEPTPEPTTIPPASKASATSQPYPKRPVSNHAPTTLLEPDADTNDESGWEVAHINAAEAPQISEETRPAHTAFHLPDSSIMQRGEAGLDRSAAQHREAAEMAERLQTTLSEFGVKADVVDWIEGPTCTTYEVNPGEGVRVNRFTSLEDDIARALARISVRIYAPVPGTSYIGIEVPNTTRQKVYFGDVLPYVDGGPLDFAVGLDANGQPVHVDLAKLPHILVAGTTGSGKSVMVNTIVMSFLMRDTPDEVRLIMIDPKQVEFKDYNGIPHLIMPVVTDMRQAAAALQWGVTEMDRRYRLMSSVGVRDLASYNNYVAAQPPADPESGEPQLSRLPSIVIVIDELADLMMVAKKDVEASIVRIAQLGRACGVHLVMATQSPRADVVTGLIRANVANRVGLKVAKSTDSKIVIDQMGAEKLLGNGDMLFLQTDWGDKPRRIQGCWISDAEISQVVTFLKEQSGPEYNYQMASLPGQQLVADVDINAPVISGGGSVSQAASDGDEPLAWEAAQLVVENQMGSTSMLQRRLKLGYARAGRVMDMLEEMGIVGPARGSKPRDVLIHDLDELDSLRGKLSDTEGGY